MRISYPRYAGLALSCAAALFSSTVTASSQERQPCGPDGEAIIAHLQKEYGEDVVAIALNERDHMVRWLANRETGTWSQVVTMPNGAGCLTASGKHFDIILNVVGQSS